MEKSGGSKKPSFWTGEGFEGGRRKQQLGFSNSPSGGEGEEGEVQKRHRLSGGAAAGVICGRRPVAAVQCVVVANSCTPGDAAGGRNEDGGGRSGNGW